MSTAGAFHVEPPPVFHASAYFALSAFSLAMSRWSGAPNGSVVAQVPHQPPSSGLGIR